MIKSKSLLLLRSFSPAEISKFSDFIDSPYFNRNSRIAKLFNELKKYYPEFESRGLEKENLYKKMFPGKPYNEQVMKNLISELLKLEKQFITVNGFLDNEFKYSLDLVSALTTKNTEPLIWKEVDTLRRLLKNTDIVSDQINLYSHLLEEKLFSYYISSNNQSVSSGLIESSGEQVTIYFLKTIFRLSINNHINRFSFNLDIEKNFPDMIIANIDLEKFLEYLEIINKNESIYLRLFYYSLQSVKDSGNDIIYKEYRDLLFEKINILNEGDKKLFLHLMESLCAQKINAGKAQYYRDLFETFEYEVENSLYGTDLSKMTVLKFRNIILCAIRCGEYDWAEKFIHNFKSKLNKEDRKNVVELALAQLNFEKKDFNATLDHLKKIKTEQVFFKVDVRNLNLMSLYELGYYENAVSLIESFKKLLNNKKLFTEQYSLKNINFANSVNSLIKHKLDSNVKELHLLKHKIEDYEVLSNKKWLKSKIDEVLI